MNTLEFLAQVSACINANGKFAAGKDVKNGSAPRTTGDEASEAIMDGEQCFEASDLDTATEALAWIRSYVGDSKFLTKLAAQVAMDDLLFRNAAFAAWVIPAYQGKDSQGTDLSAYSDAVYYGVVGGEAAFKGTVLGVFVLKGGRFGDQSFVTLTDNRNHVFLWKTAGSRSDLKPGQAVRCVGKIKEHAVYKGVNQTRITHAKISILPTPA